MTKFLLGVLLVVLVGVLLAPAASAASPPSTALKGLDYLHGHQCGDGGFSTNGTSGNATDTPWVVLAAAAADNDPTLWKAAGRNPLSFLQNTNLAAAAASSGNAPAYYALCILAYAAADRLDLLTKAGSDHIDLVASLESFQSAQGYFSAVPSSVATAGTETTAWAVLALVAAKTVGTPVSAAVAWLQAPPAADGSGGGPNADGGFGAQPAAQSGVTATSLAVQALVAAGAGSESAAVEDAASFLKTLQTADGGFSDVAGDSSNIVATAWATEGLLAVGNDPDQISSGDDPASFLASARQKDGSYGPATDAVQVTAQAVIALAGRTLPVAPASGKLTADLDPQFASVVPRPGARLASASLLVKVTYHDSPYGPGLVTPAISVRLDGHNKTRASSISATHLTLRLLHLKNGRHTLVVSIPDEAGNVAVLHRTFTVATPTATAAAHSSPGASPSAPAESSSRGGTNPASVAVTAASSAPSPTPITTLSPTAASSSPSTTGPTPSVGRRSTHRKFAVGRPSAEVIIGVSLAALVPLGSLGPWLRRRRLLRAMEGATWGEVLPEHLSRWPAFLRAKRPFGDDEWS